MSLQVCLFIGEGRRLVSLDITSGNSPTNAKSSTENKEEIVCPFPALFFLDAGLTVIFPTSAVIVMVDISESSNKICALISVL